MTDEMRALSVTEIDAVAGGLQYQANDQAWLMNPNPPGNATKLVVMPDPAYVEAPAKDGAEGKN